jgi:hypothetical protein
MRLYNRSGHMLAVVASAALAACNNPAENVGPAPVPAPSETPAAIAGAGGTQPPVGLTPVAGAAGIAALPAAGVASVAGAVAAGAGGTPVLGPVAGALGAAVPTGQGGQAGSSEPAAPLPAATLAITIPRVAPGAEDTQCVQVRLPSTVQLNVIKLHNRLTAGSHHLIVTALNDANAMEHGPKPCQGFGGAVSGAPLAITQAHDDVVQLPEGIGYQLKAGHVMHLEMHFINTGESTLDVTGTVEFYAAAPGAIVQQAGVLLVGTADFVIPAHGTLETPTKYLALPAGMDDVKFYAITGHTHRFGTKVNVASATPPMTKVADLYAPQAFNWESPEMKHFTPHVTIPKGGGFMLQCAWNNMSNVDIRWGESANTEMCFFWGYYYPKKDVFPIVVDNIDQSLLKEIAGTPPTP